MNNRISVSNSCVVVKAEDNGETLAALQDFYPIHTNRKKTEFKLSSRIFPEVLNKLRGDVNIDSLPDLPRSVYTNELSARRTLNNLLDYGPANSPIATETLTLRQHQQLGREIANIRDRFCFFFDTRTGKTPLSISIINDSLKEDASRKWLVICPLILIENAWLEDFAKFAPGINVANCHAATKAKRIKAIESDASVYITNTESFATYREYFDKIKFEGCIVDESSDLKSYKSKQSQSIVDFAQTVRRMYLLSGSPAPNGEWEYYMQLKAIDYYSVPEYWTPFKEHFFVDISFSQYEQLQLRPDRKEEFNALLKKYALYVDKEDVLTLPGRTFTEVEFELPEDLRKSYRQMKNDLCMELQNEHKITAASSAAKLNKLNQITSGFIMDTQARKENEFYGDTLSEWYLLDNYRFEKLQSLLCSDDVRGEQVLIWANYRKEFEIIQSILGERCRCIYGGTTLNEKNEAIRLFKSGAIPYLIANPASADKGLTLTNCHICIYFSLNWSYELYKQSMDRIYGDISKQPDHCQYYILIAKNTIDGILYRDVLQGKQDASYAILNHLKSNS